MGARRDLRDHPAIGLVRGILAGHGLRQDAPVAADQRDAGVVARGFEAQYQTHFVAGPLPEGRAMH
jgi:hypothetical protein